MATAVFGRRHAGLLLERATEILGVCEAYGIGYLGKRHPRVGHHLLGFHHADVAHEVNGRHPRKGLHLAVEHRAAYGHSLGQVVYLQVLVGYVLVDEGQQGVGELLVGDCHAWCVGRDDEVAVGSFFQLVEPRLLQAAALADDVGHARLQVVHAEGLGDVVVNALVQAFYAVIHGRAGRKHDDGDVAYRGVGLNAAHHLHAVHHGHHYVRNDKVGLHGLSLLKAFKAVARLGHGVVGRERGREEIAQLVVVLNHEHPRALASALRLRPGRHGRRYGSIVGWAHVGRQVGLHLAVQAAQLVEVKRLVNQFEHAPRVFLHKFEVSARLGRQRFLVEHLAYGASYERQRRAQLVGNVGEKAELTLLHAPLQTGVLPEPPHVKQGESGARGGHDVYQPGPTALPERGQHTYLKLAGVSRPHAVGVGAPHLKRVAARRYVAERRAVLRPRVAPLVVKLLYAVSIAYLAVV